jgi:hypothetical protein
VGGAPGNGGFSSNGGTDACTAASLPNAPGCDASTVVSAAQVYCDSVNQLVANFGTLNCSVLTNPNYVPSPLPAVRSGGDCSTYWEPASSAVSSSTYGSCQKVTLLLTQWRDRARHELIANGVCVSSPLVLDLDGDGIHLSSLAQGVSFDLLARGREVRSAWTDGRDALLALDRNENGQIDDATELFGNATGGEDFADGFAALATLDDNGDGAIDARDAAYSSLVLWRDANRDGRSDPGELVALHDAGVRRIFVLAVRRDRASSLDEHGNELTLVSQFERTDGSRGMVADAFLRYRP